MKQKLLLVGALAFTGFMNAQSIIDENCTALNIGNVANDITGGTAGQNNWYTYTAAGANTDFQVVDVGGANGNAFQVTGSNTATNTKFLFKDISAEWAARTGGNNILEVEYDFFTGPATTSLNSQGIRIYDASGSKVLAGLVVTMNTLLVRGVAYLDNAGTLGNYAINLGAGGAALNLARNTWYRLGFSFNLTTGEVIFREKNNLFNGNIAGAGAGINPLELDIVAQAGTGNAAASTGIYDNIVTRASNTDTLSNEEVYNSLASDKLSVYPIPAHDVVNLTVADNNEIIKSTITDVNGRVVKMVKSDAKEITVEGLDSGVYFLTVDTKQGSITKKIVKK